MSYVLAGVLVLAIVAIGATVLIVNAKQHRHERRRAAADPSYGAGRIGARGRHRAGGEGARIAPPVDGGEGEGRRRI